MPRANTWVATPPAAAWQEVPKVSFGSRVEAYAGAVVYAAENGGSVTITSGTPSMEPLIHGRTYAVIQNLRYDLIRKYDLLVYLGRPGASLPDRERMLHRAVKHDRHGWIMSGDNNRWSESWDRVTPTTYIGTVVALFAFPNGVACTAGIATSQVSLP